MEQYKMAKRNFIKLIKEVDKETGEIVKQDTYLTPTFLSFRLIYEATSTMTDLEEQSERQAMDTMLQMVVDIYGGQFTKDELIDGLNSTEAVEELESQISFVASGAMEDARKKELAKLI